jgi:hypothetical protein
MVWFGPTSGRLETSGGRVVWRGLVGEVGVGDGFVAVWARAAGADASAEQVAGVAAAGVEVSLLTGRAFVDGVGGLRLLVCCWWWCRVGFGDGGGSLPVCVLSAGVGAVLASSGCAEGLSAAVAGDHRSIVTVIVTDGVLADCVRLRGETVFVFGGVSPRIVHQHVLMAINTC